ncbi:hypothetical protein ACIBL6_34665 [Streptomyces sp. NPDC050400]|uniref:hypothetical protein n=1 Tax=Streptomyces sp. NPDC050400 TaxID=3365610 RepID=UPI0037B29B05
MSPTTGHGPDKRFRKYEQDEHAGNATVNDGPRRPADAAADDASGPDTLGGTGLGDDELALRRMMRTAVAEIEPSDVALEHLRRAVPARRARKRQAAVGAIAAGVFVAMAVPAVLHVTNSGSSADPAMAGNSQNTHSGVAAGKDGGAGQDSGGSPSQSKDKGKGKDGDKGKKGDKGKGATSGATGGPGPGSTAAASSPLCAANELSAVASVGTPDGSGKVYGSFRVSNVSAGNCTVDGGGSVLTVAQGAADPTKVGVLDHTSGDGSGLPDPSAEQSQLILEPGMAYEVKFAWVPSGQCTPSGGTGGGTGGNGGNGGGEVSPSPTPSENATGDSGEATADSGLSAQLGSEGTGDGSVSVSHTAEPGAPSATTVIPDACAGTVYRTGVLPAS